MQLNLMHAELSRRLQTNEAEHQRLWDTIEETTSEVGNLGGKLSNVQHVLDGTTNTAHQVIESLVRDSRGALEAVRGESLVALQNAMLKHETNLRALHDTLVAEVTREFLGVRAELDATQERPRLVGGTAAAAAAAAPKSAAGVPQAQPPQSSDPLLRADPWGAAANLGGSAGSRPPSNGLLPFELDVRMWEGPSRDRKPLEMSNDTTGYGAW